MHADEMLVFGPIMIAGAIFFARQAWLLVRYRNVP